MNSPEFPRRIARTAEGHVNQSEAKHRTDALCAPRRARWLLRGIVAVPVVFLVAGGILWWTQGRVVARKLAAIRERGEPVTAADLEAFYVRPPPDKDATELWMSAGVKLTAATQLTLVSKLPFAGNGPAPPPPGQPWKELPLAEQFLSDNAAAMQMLHDAAAKGGAARFPTDFSQGIVMLLPEVQKIRQCARCLALEACVRAHHGDAAGVADSLRTILSLTRSLENEPLMISQMVRIAVCGFANGQLKELLPATDFSDEDLARLEDELLATDFREALRRALLGERVMGLIAFDNPNGLGMGGATRFAQRLVFSRDMAAYLQVMEEYAAAAKQFWPGALEDTKSVSQEFMVHASRWNVLTQTVVPAMDAMAEAAARGTAQCRVMALAIALERYRRAHGTPPAKLDELAPMYIQQVPLDPYTGQPFHYQASDAGYVVYSLGGIKASEETDAETGALERLLFRWPPKSKPTPDDAGEAAPEADKSAPVDEP